MIYKYCRRCGRRLEGENRLIGYGKICLEKAKAENPLFVLVPMDRYPIEITSEQGEKSENLQGSAKQGEVQQFRAEQQSQAESKQENAEQSQEQSKGAGVKEKFSSEQSKGVQPPHLEKTLTPTYKKGLLFTPHTATPTPYI